jgi:hypothetical protein
MLKRSAPVAVVASVLTSTSAALGQTASLFGTVVRDSLGHEVAGAEVMLPDLRRAVKANYRGEFKIGRLPAGRHALMIRQVGFAMRYDTRRHDRNCRRPEFEERRMAASVISSWKT